MASIEGRATALILAAWRQSLNAAMPAHSRASRPAKKTGLLLVHFARLAQSLAVRQAYRDRPKAKEGLLTQGRSLTTRML